MKRVAKLSPLDKHCTGKMCSGACPLCGGCVSKDYGFMGGTLGVYQFCADNDDCNWGEVRPDPELEAP